MSDSTRVRGLVRLLPFLARLRFPHLFLILAGLMALNWLTPDPVPLVDEFMLTVLTLMAGAWRGGAAPQKPPEKNVTPPGSAG